MWWHEKNIFYQITINCKGPQTYRVFSDDFTAAILVFQNNETAAMLVYQDNPVEVEFFSYAKAFFCSNKFAYMLATWVETLYIQQILGCIEDLK